jgi:uncharacterized protein (TIGR03435 family)
VKAILIAIALGGVAAATSAQTPAAPRFDVVSVKRNTSGDVASSVRPEPNGLTAVNTTLMRLIRVAYQIADFQVVDAPGWFTSERYDVAARTTEPVTIAQIGTMLKALLTDRFGLRIVQQRREAGVLELRVDRDRLRMTPSAQPCGLVQAGTANAPIASSASRQTPPCFSSLAGEMIARGVTTGMVAQELTRRLERFVVDRTDLTNAFDFDLRWAPDTGAAAPDAAPSDLPPLVTAVQEQLGLRLVPARAPVDVYVVAAASRPTPD